MTELKIKHHEYDAAVFGNLRTSVVVLDDSYYVCDRDVYKATLDCKTPSRSNADASSHLDNIKLIVICSPLSLLHTTFQLEGSGHLCA